VSLAIEPAGLGTLYPQFPSFGAGTEDGAVCSEAPIFFNFAENINPMVAIASTMSATQGTVGKTIPPGEPLGLSGHPDTIRKSTSPTLYVVLILARIIGTWICKAVEDPSD
jgi:hypothetical protein